MKRLQILPCRICGKLLTCSVGTPASRVRDERGGPVCGDCCSDKEYDEISLLVRQALLRHYSRKVS
jgi:hypothetical protein